MSNYKLSIHILRGNGHVFVHKSYYVIKYCVLKVVLVVFVMFCIDDNPFFGFLDQ